MLKKSRKLLAWILFLITAAAPVTEAFAGTTFYTYSYDYFGNELESPNAYTAQKVLLGNNLGSEVGDFNNPKGLFVKNDLIYIVDTGNDRIVVIDKYFKLVRIINKVILEGKEDTLLKPTDIYVSDNGDLYICDTDKFRILHTDKDLNVIKTYIKPVDENFAADLNFIPLKCVVDNAGRLYLMAGNVNKGFMKFEKDGTFTGYIGANPAKVSVFEALKKRFMTKEQRKRMELFVPTEYSNIAIDNSNFLYATTDSFFDSELRRNKSQVNPIRKLNALGQDILIKNGYENPIGDVYWGNGGDVSGSSRFSDITAFDNDSYYAIDRNRGRIFGYDFQGNLLYAFGGLGNKVGYFLYPLAIEHIGDDILILDNRNASLTRFTLTQYGALINQSLSLYKEGRYEESAQCWEKVIRMNGNYDLAYIGIGRALLRQGKYKEAMKYFRIKRDTKNYSKAFTEYRKQWVDANIGKMITVLIILIILPKVIKKIRKRHQGGVKYDENKGSI